MSGKNYVAPPAEDSELAGRIEWLSARLRSAECTGVSAIVSTHKLADGRREGYRLVLAYGLTTNGGAPGMREFTRELAASTWGWGYEGGLLIPAELSASAHEVVTTAEARLGLARGTLAGYASI